MKLSDYLDSKFYGIDKDIVDRIDAFETMAYMMGYEILCYAEMQMFSICKNGMVLVYIGFNDEKMLVSSFHHSFFTKEEVQLYEHYTWDEMLGKLERAL